MSLPTIGTVIKINKVYGRIVRYTNFYQHYLCVIKPYHLMNHNLGDKLMTTSQSYDLTQIHYQVCATKQVVTHRPYERYVTPLFEPIKPNNIYNYLDKNYIVIGLHYFKNQLMVDLQYNNKIISVAYDQFLKSKFKYIGYNNKPLFINNHKVITNYMYDIDKLQMEIISRFA